MPPTRGTSDVWKCFNKKDGNTATCKICFKTLKTSGNTSNLLKHLKTHPGSAKVERANAPKNRDLRNLLPSTTTTAAAASASTFTATAVLNNENSTLNEEETITERAGSSHHQLTIIETLKRVTSYSEGGSHYEQLIKHLLYFICVDNRPFEIINGEGFRRLVKFISPNVKLPAVDTLKRRLDDIYDVVYHRYENKFKDGTVAFYALTFDIWSEMMTTRSFLGVTIHFVGENEIQSKILAVAQLTTRHTSLNIAKEIDECCIKFSLKKENISAVVTDNGPNVVRAVTMALESSKHLPCFAHTINLVVEGILKDEETNRIITKVRETVKWFKNSVVQSDLLREKQGSQPLKLILDVQTRWNSRYYMLERYAKLRNVVNEILLQNPRSPDILTAGELNTMQKIVVILQPFEYVTRDICGEKYVTSSKIIPTVNCLREKINNVKPTSDDNDDKQFVESMKVKVFKEIDRRFANIEANHLLAVSTILDPRFKNIHFKDANACAKAISFIRRAVNSESDSLSSLAVNRNSPVIEDDDFWGHHQMLAHSRRQRSTDSDKDEMSLYLANPVFPLKSNPFQQWEDMKTVFPGLYNLAIRFLIIPGTSVPSERLFSKAGALITETRNRLLGSRVSKLLFLSDCTGDDFGL